MGGVIGFIAEDVHSEDESNSGEPDTDTNRQNDENDLDRLITSPADGNNMNNATGGNANNDDINDVDADNQHAGGQLLEDLEEGTRRQDLRNKLTRSKSNKLLFNPWRNQKQKAKEVEEAISLKDGTNAY